MDDRFADVFVDLAKLADCVLSAAHPRSRHKARMRLGPADTDRLRSALISAAIADGAPLTPTDEDAYGRHFVLDFRMGSPRGAVMVRSAWIVRHDERVLRFITCYLL